VRRRLQRVEEIVAKNLASAEQALELYQPFLFLLDEEARVEAFLDDRTKTRKDFAAYMDLLRATVAKLHEQCPSRIHMQLLRIEAGDVNRRLVQCAQDCISRLLRTATTRNEDRCVHLAKRFEVLQVRVSRTPYTEEQLVEVESALEDAKERELPELMGEYEDVKAWLFFAWDSGHLLTEKDYDAIYLVSEWKDFGSFLADREAAVLKDRRRLEERLGERSRQLLEDLAASKARIGRFKDKANARMLEDYLEQIADIEKHLSTTSQAVAELQRREELLGWDKSDFEEMEDAHKALEPFKSLWVLVQEHQKASALWMRSPLFGSAQGLEIERVEEEVNSMHSRAVWLRAFFEQEGHARPGTVARKLVSELDLVKDSLPLLKAVCNRALQDRHWKEIDSVLGFALDHDHSLTLQKMLDLDMASYIFEVSEISEGATKESEVESDLDAQLQEWESRAIRFEESHTKGTVSISSGSFEELQVLLDKHLVRTQALRRSPYAGCFGTRIESWEQLLTEVQSAVHLWQRVQMIWLDLEPIMVEEEGSPLEREAELFKEASQILRRLVRDCQRSPGLLEVFRQEELLRDLQAASSSLSTLRRRLGPGPN